MDVHSRKMVSKCIIFKSLKHDIRFLSDYQVIYKDLICLKTINFNFSFLFIKTSKDLSAENYQKKKKKREQCLWKVL